MGGAFSYERGTPLHAGYSKIRSPTDCSVVLGSYEYAYGMLLRRGGPYLRPHHVQGYLAHQKEPPTLGPPEGPRHSSATGSQVGAVSYERGTPVRRGGPYLRAAPVSRLFPEAVLAGMQVDLQWVSGPITLRS